MGFLDNIRDKFRGGSDDEYYEDDYYDEGYDDGSYEDRRSRRSTADDGHAHLLGNTPRPEAESVSVYTRSGRPLGTSSAAAPAPVSSYDANATRSFQPQQAAPSYANYDTSLSSNQTPTPGDLGVAPVARSLSGQLPAYVLRPTSYDDVQSVVSRVKTNQPVVLVFRNTNIEVAKRILDFSFGLSLGVGGEVSELGDRVFAVLPAGIQLSGADINKLVVDGDLVR